jgi:hypothetical protein
MSTLMLLFKAVCNIFQLFFVCRGREGKEVERETARKEGCFYLFSSNANVSSESVRRLMTTYQTTVLYRFNLLDSFRLCVIVFC